MLPGTDDPGPLMAKESNEKFGRATRESLKTLESEKHKQTFERFLKQYAPDLITSYRELIILAIARAREVAAVVAFVEGDDYSQWGFVAIPMPKDTEHLGGASVNVDDLFE